MWKYLLPGRFPVKLRRGIAKQFLLNTKLFSQSLHIQFFGFLGGILGCHLGLGLDFRPVNRRQLLALGGSFLLGLGNHGVHIQHFRGGAGRNLIIQAFLVLVGIVIGI